MLFAIIANFLIYTIANRNNGLTEESYIDLNVSALTYVPFKSDYEVVHQYIEKFNNSCNLLTDWSVNNDYKRLFHMLIGKSYYNCALDTHQLTKSITSGERECSMNFLSGYETCNLVNKFSNVLFYGNSFTRHMVVALFIF